ncbi:hypothetical protein LEL_04675 [Akanthomyces lecanii RCEF 1005]|uniref:Uncharacterized protein n=1 Tax=Akanthomyces lecanii RCEF 1005 TaxID=1081108 RepID=A0A162K4I4_CORDF|nr:hypothetical protein LEL_04675 [Akanthomyces lecanii RCEF 1005]
MDGAPFPTLSVERVQFDAGLELDANGDPVRTPSMQGAPQYVGQPSDEIDTNWDLLIPSDMNITRDEAEQIGGAFYFYPDTDIATIEISTFHVLHCLDEVRQSVYWQTYLPDGVTKLQQVHVGMSSENKSGISKKKHVLTMKQTTASML